MKRKTIRNNKTAGVKAIGKTRTRRPKRHVEPKTERADVLDAMVAASAEALGLPVDPAWRPNVRFNLGLILRFAALVEEFPLPDDAEPAPVFHA
jgi:hypothetical protein